MSEIPRPSLPLAADEATTLRAFLDRHRATLRRQAEGLTADQLAQRLPGHPATMTLGGLLKHLTFVEQWWFQVVLRGKDPEGIWADVDWTSDPDWDWHTATQHSPAELDAMLVEEIARSEDALEEALAGDGLDTLARRTRHGEAASLRWILVHLVEEYARHCGHADLLREAVDGTTDL
jgi:uncharacterized damage-inducible protein DinB